MAAEVICVAVIGLGMAAKPHLAALRQLEGPIRVGGLYTRNAERLAAQAEATGWAAYDSVQAICDDPAVDGAILITPPNAREDLVAQLARAGKHILMEKPLERDLPRAERLVARCEAAGVTLGVVLQHRFRAGSMALADLIASGKLGPIRAVRLALPWWRAQTYYDAPGRGTYAQDGGGVLLTQAVHVLDLMLSLTGPVTEVQALTATTALHQMEAEDFATAGMIFANGAVGSMVATTAAFPGSPESLALDADHGAAVLTAGELVVHWRDGTRDTVGELSATGGGSDPMDFPCDWHRDLICDFADALRNDRPPRITGRAALEAHKLIAAIELSACEGRKIKVQP
ncbi:Myo-inositol 2-dehydrogenase [Roseobacter fucihabitans]|uniref:Myo-inositol 2-dehydrogenase n=1 Tax=Roseobacter fucihabitans TaxID=1537242 RepID=A0ABZ2BQG4_9RHOB|nr:Gfo/Idh/MocA family oxidoreductase [Roseobacter litoralis]MBC6964170.1 1,5-anhydro-D-fructose reductase [Roseobacter litoralis]